MDSIPLKMPQGAPQTVNEDVDVTIPDYLRILQETEVSFLCQYHSETACLRLHVCLQWNSHLNFLLRLFCFLHETNISITIIAGNIFR